MKKIETIEVTPLMAKRIDNCLRRSGRRRRYLSKVARRYHAIHYAQAKSIKRIDLEKIADALDINVDYILSGDPDRKFEYPFYDVVANVGMWERLGDNNGLTEPARNEAIEKAMRYDAVWFFEWKKGYEREGGE